MIDLRTGHKICLVENLRMRLDLTDAKNSILIRYVDVPGVIKGVITDTSDSTIHEVFHYFAEFTSNRGIKASFRIKKEWIDYEKSLESMMNEFIPGYTIGCELKIVNLDHWGKISNLGLTFKSTVDLQSILHSINSFKNDNETCVLDPYNTHRVNYRKNSLAVYYADVKKDEVQTSKLNNKYRLKTEQEFIEEFGYDWRKITKWAPTPELGMDHLLGQYITTELAERVLVGGSHASSEENFLNVIPGKDYRWSIHDLMITEKPLFVTSEPLHVTPVETPKSYRLKTKKEFIAEFGEKFHDHVNWNSEGRMDHMFGAEIHAVFAKLVLKNGSTQCARGHFKQVISGKYYGWTIDARMITDKPLLQYLEPEKIEPARDSWLWTHPACAAPTEPFITKKTIVSSINTDYTSTKNTATDEVVIVDTQLRKTGKNKSIIF